MPLKSFRQLRARRVAEVTLAGAVALTVIAAPGLFRDSDGRNVEAAAAGAPTTEAPASDATTTDLLTNVVFSTPVNNDSSYDEHALRTRLANSAGYRMTLAYASASPDERAALDIFFAPPPPPAPAPEPKPAPEPRTVAVSAPAVSDGSVWDRVATCESHNVWSTHTANGFSGGLQFADGTWRSYGGTAYAPQAWQASREAQIVVAERVLADAGWKAWPACSRKLGLR